MRYVFGTLCRCTLTFPIGSLLRLTSVLLRKRVRQSSHYAYYRVRLRAPCGGELCCVLLLSQQKYE